MKLSAQQRKILVMLLKTLMTLFLRTSLCSAAPVNTNLVDDEIASEYTEEGTNDVNDVIEVNGVRRQEDSESVQNSTRDGRSFKMSFGDISNNHIDFSIGDIFGENSDEVQNGEWSSYGPCSKICGGGMKERSCNPGYGGRTCRGSGRSSCNTRPCAGVSKRGAIEAFKATVKVVADGLCNEEESSGSKRHSWIHSFSDNEKKLLEILVEVTKYMQNACSSSEGNCQLKTMKVFVEMLTTTFYKIKSAGKCSPGFVRYVGEMKTTFDFVASVAEESEEKGGLTTANYRGLGLLNNGGFGTTNSGGLGTSNGEGWTLLNNVGSSAARSNEFSKVKHGELGMLDRGGWNPAHHGGFNAVNNGGFSKESHGGLGTANSGGLGGINNGGWGTVSNGGSGNVKGGFDTASSGGFGTARSGESGNVNNGGFGTASSGKFGRASNEGSGNVKGGFGTASGGGFGNVNNGGSGIVNNGGFSISNRGGFGKAESGGLGMVNNEQLDIPNHGGLGMSNHGGSSTSNNGVWNLAKSGGVSTTNNGVYSKVNYAGLGKAKAGGNYNGGLGTASIKKNGGSVSPNNGGLGVAYNGLGTSNSGNWNLPNHGGLNTASNGGFNKANHGGLSSASNGGFGTANHGGFGTANHGGFGTANHGGFGTSNKGGFGTANQGGFGTANHGGSGSASSQGFGTANHGGLIASRHGGWSEYGPCSRSCGGGTKTRSCTDPSPAHGGNHCTGSASWSCNTHPCPPIHRGWSAWSEFSTCTATCGPATRTRKRACSNSPPYGGGPLCQGSFEETSYCEIISCGVGGKKLVRDTSAFPATVEIQWPQSDRCLFGCKEKYLLVDYHEDGKKGLNPVMKVYVAKDELHPPDEFSTSGYKEFLHFGNVPFEEHDVEAMFYVLHPKDWKPFQSHFKTPELSAFVSHAAYTAVSVTAMILAGAAIGSVVFPVGVLAGAAIGGGASAVLGIEATKIFDIDTGPFLHYIGF